jgi:hypothetical protein
MCRQNLQCFGGEGQARIGLLQEMLGQRHDVFHTLPQRRHAQTNLAQPMIQIAPEAAGFHHVLQILIGGRDDTHVHGHFAGTPQPVVRHAIQDTQKLYLHARFQFADLVQEQRPVMRQFEQPRFGGVGAAEGAFFVAKQLAFYQMLRQGGATDVYPRLGASQGIMMDGPGNQFLAGAAFACN